jgi:hypothetical protein
VIASRLERAYRRLGPRYLPRALFLQQQVVIVLIVVGVAILSLYVRMSLGQFIRIALVAAGLQIVFIALTVRVVRRLTGPVARWLEGAKSEEATIAAWRAAAVLPWDVLRHQLFSRALAPFLWSMFAIAALYITWELSLPVSSGLLIYLGASLLIAYAAGLRFFAIERLVRPVLEDIGAALPAEALPHAPGLSLRGRLLIALPAINVITAVPADRIGRGAAVRHDTPGACASSRSGSFQPHTHGPSCSSAFAMAAPGPAPPAARGHGHSTDVLHRVQDAYLCEWGARGDDRPGRRTASRCARSGRPGSGGRT